MSLPRWTTTTLRDPISADQSISADFFMRKPEISMTNGPRRYWFGVRHLFTRRRKHHAARSHASHSAIPHTHHGDIAARRLGLDDPDLTLSTSPINKWRREGPTSFPAVQLLD